MPWLKRLAHQRSAPKVEKFPILPPSRCAKFFPAQLPFKTIDLIGGFEVLNG
jgi:hypothetical protein